MKNTTTGKNFRTKGKFYMLFLSEYYFYVNSLIVS
jgi:hypothetical protein